MTKEEKSRYSEPEVLREILIRVLSGMKVTLDCGHHANRPGRLIVCSWAIGGLGGAFMTDYYRYRWK